MVRLRDVLDDGQVEVYEFNRCFTAPGLCGALIYRGDSKLIKPELLKREVCRMYDYAVPVYIVF